ncbi:unnamed protein product [Rotaria magnacalcarata]|uniref:Tetratricopeptide repeat protein n=2 Tax=Rotaria magnacalcarata TaxID=392030 RepID=A0A816U019_9BILA|nr:unnamed protein product [Rotaria magnacalcarata]
MGTIDDSKLLRKKVEELKMFTVPASPHDSVEKDFRVYLDGVLPILDQFIRTNEVWNNTSSKIFLDELPPTDFDLSVVYNNLGHTYKKVGNFKKALDHFNVSIDLYLKPSESKHIININRKLGCVYNNKGLVSRDLREFDDALEYINKSLALRHADGTLSEKQGQLLAIERSYCHENLGILYKDTCKYELAVHHLEQTLDIRKKNLP